MYKGGLVLEQESWDVWEIKIPCFGLYTKPESLYLGIG